MFEVAQGFGISKFWIGGGGVQMKEIVNYTWGKGSILYHGD